MQTTRINKILLRVSKECKCVSLIKQLISQNDIIKFNHKIENDITSLNFLHLLPNKSRHKYYDIKSCAHYFNLIIFLKCEFLIENFINDNKLENKINIMLNTLYTSHKSYDLNEYLHYLKTNNPIITDFFLKLFVWDNTQEGHSYWHSMDKKFLNYITQEFNRSLTKYFFQNLTSHKK